MLSKTIKDVCYDIKRANGIPDNYICKQKPYERKCLSCKKKLKATEQLCGFCKECQILLME